MRCITRTRPGRRAARALSILVCLLGIHASTLCQQQLGRGVLSSGGVGMTSASGSRMQGSVSQTAIGITRSAGQVAELGYWYTIMQARPGYSMIMIPNIQASVGQRFQIPVMHSTSASMFAGEERTFTVKIRFNKTMIEILDTVEYDETATDYIVTLSGSTRDTLSTLISLNVRARLGNDTTTQLTIDDFTWTNASRIRPRMEMVAGTFSTIGVCTEGGIPRLVKTINLTSIRAYPNPADVTTSVAVRLDQAANARVSIHDLAGELMQTIHDGQLDKGLHTFAVNLESMPSGVYMVRLETATEVLSHQLIIKK